MDADLLGLMEAQRWRLAMFASCAWFWDVPDRIETAGALRAAVRAARLVDGLAGTDLEARLLADLRPARPARQPMAHELFASRLGSRGRSQRDRDRPMIRQPAACAPRADEGSGHCYSRLATEHIWTIPTMSIELGNRHPPRHRSTGGSLDVERDSDVPISTQIYWQLAYQIDSGRLLPVRGCRPFASSVPRCA